MKTSLLSYFAIAALGCAACATDDATDSDGATDENPGDDGKGDDPTTTNGTVGPGAGAHITFRATAQKGGFWELSSGDLYTAFRTSTEQLTYGRERQIFEYGLVAPDVANPDTAEILGSAGSCIDEGNNSECKGGLLGPSTQKGTTLATSDNRLLIVSNVFASGEQHPQLRLMDPTGATPTEVRANFTSVPSSSGNPAISRLLRLPTGQLVVSASGNYASITKTFLLDATGIIAELDGFAVGYRTGPLELAILRHPANFTREYVWWNPATKKTSPAGTIVVSINERSHNFDRPVITSDGELVLWPHEGAEKRIVRFDRDGALISDKMLPSTINAITPSGDLLLIKNVNVNPGWDWSVVLAKPDGTERTLYDRGALSADVGWNITWNYTGNATNLNAIEALFDDAGNLYLSIVKSSSNAYETYLVGFDSDGDKQFGLAFDTVYSSQACKAHSVLRSGRLAVVCESRLNNDLYLLDD
jgi:hypothetical protein